jgi:hypothetical protein
LNLLLRQIPSDSATGISTLDLSSLTVFAAEARYPGDYPDATNEAARQAVQLSGRVLNIIKDLCK